MAPPRPIDPEVGIAAVRAARAQLASAPAPAGYRPPGARDVETRLRHQVAELEAMNRQNRAGRQRAEAALNEIFRLTRRMTGQTTSRVHELAAVALGLEQEPAVSEEPFTE